MSTEKRVYEYIKSLLEELVDIDLDTVSFDTPVEDLDMDSLDKVQVQIALKREFGVELSEEHLTDAAKTTIGDICRLVSEAASVAAE